MFSCFSIGTVFNNRGITNPRCGDSQSYSLPRGKGVSFFCRPVLFGRYVTIRSLGTDREHFTLCEVEVYSERRGNTLYIKYLYMFENLTLIEVLSYYTEELC